LCLKGYGFKFFVWDKIKPFFINDARPDRVSQYELIWTRKNLELVLQKRLLAFSDGNINSFRSIMDKDPGYQIDSVLCMIANRSPRNLIRICEKIISSQAEIDQASKFVTAEAVDKGILMYCEQITSEIYGEEVVKDFLRVGKELFTINYLANEIFKTTHENTSRNKVTKWQNNGAVKQIGIISVKESRKPVNLYYVADPALIRLINQPTNLEQFIKDRWLVCDHCSSDNLMDISFFPEGNDPVCHECGAKLIH
jgi:hypothetical protein